jgi:hypothetical protein
LAKPKLQQIYHASCHADASGNMEMEISTSDDKKRKAEDDLNQDNKLVKTES